jgi:uncharacterized membrane protein
VAEFDLKKVTTNDWILAGGCIAVFLGVFFKWFAVGGGTVAGFTIPEYSVNGFHYFLQGTIPWIIAIAILVLLVLRKFFSEEVKMPDQAGSLSWPQVYLIASAVAAVLVLLRLLTGDSGVDRKFGLYLTSIGVIAMVVGAFLKFQAKEDDAAGAGPTTPPTPF